MTSLDHESSAKLAGDFLMFHTHLLRLSKSRACPERYKHSESTAHALLPARLPPRTRGHGADAEPGASSRRAKGVREHAAGGLCGDLLSLCSPLTLRRKP